VKIHRTAETVCQKAVSLSTVSFFSLLCLPGGRVRFDRWRRRGAPRSAGDRLPDKGCVVLSVGPNGKRCSREDAHPAVVPEKRHDYGQRAVVERGFRVSGRFARAERTFGECGASADRLGDGGMQRVAETLMEAPLNRRRVKRLLTVCYPRILAAQECTTHGETHMTVQAVLQVKTRR
jgi:hypothetical protein